MLGQVPSESHGDHYIFLFQSIFDEKIKKHLQSPEIVQCTSNCMYLKP